ncbi:MAG: cation:proton antiporter [Anaerolineae bacterium]|nr:cation:proton antiporter [Anaerolineae bacterium]
MSSTTRIVLFTFWEYVAFVITSLVFLTIGLEINLPLLANNIVPIGIALIATLLSRAVVVYGLTWLFSHQSSQNIPLSYRHVLFWGGLRGAIGVALALSLPYQLNNRSLLQSMTFGVVIFTVLLQGTTMRWLLRRLNLINGDDEGEQNESREFAQQSASAEHEVTESLE